MNLSALGCLCDAGEEALESQQAGEWTEDMAENVPKPDEPKMSAEEMERLPSDRG